MAYFLYALLLYVSDKLTSGISILLMNQYDALNYLGFLNVLMPFRASPLYAYLIF